MLKLKLRTRRVIYRMLCITIALVMATVFFNSILIGMGETSGFVNLGFTLLWLTLLLNIRRHALATMEPSPTPLDSFLVAFAREMEKRYPTMDSPQLTDVKQ